MKYNILITEDEREIAELIKLYLENESYMVFCAEDGNAQEQDSQVEWQWH